MKKKNIILIVAIAIFILMLIPIPVRLKDGGSVEYKAILYKYTKIHRLSEKSSTGYEDGWELEILEIKIGGKIDTHTKDIQVEIEPTYKDIQNRINEYLTKNAVNLSNYAYSYTDDNNRKVIIGLIDNNEDNQNDFFDKVFKDCCGVDYINYIKENNMIEFKESKEVFEAKIIETKDSSMTVEVLKDCQSFKVKDKVVVKITRPTNGTNDFYVKGNNVRIIFSGMVETSNPPQIGAVKVELIS